MCHSRRMLFRAKVTAPNGTHPLNECFSKEFVKNLSQYKCVIQEECCSEQKVQHQGAHL
jgi:hypothetical protein